MESKENRVGLRGVLAIIRSPLFSLDENRTNDLLSNVPLADLLTS
jgi:hypothetical protein